MQWVIRQLSRDDEGREGGKVVHCFTVFRGSGVIEVSLKTDSDKPEKRVKIRE